VTLRRLLPSALLLTLLAACSSTSVRPAPDPLPANLAAECPPLALPPNPLVDPARLEWEAGGIIQYEDCRARHRETVAAWPTKKPPASRGLWSFWR
jgi:hypothetical protein